MAPSTIAGMEHLRSRIERAFPLSPVPEPPIVVTYDDEEIVPTFSGRPWNSFTVEELRTHSAAIFFLTTEAFVYYLPAFIVATIETPKTADIIPDNLLSRFAAADASRFIDQLSADQRNLLAEFFSSYPGNTPCYASDLGNALHNLVAEGGDGASVRSGSIADRR